MMAHCVQRYKCLNCNRCFIKQEELKVRKKKGLTEDEKYIIDQMLNENISYRAIARVLKRHYVFKHHSKICVLTHTQKKTE